MPRIARASVGGVCYHVINRGNGRREVFRKDGDDQAFLKAIGHACIEIPMRVLGYCLMPNHFHLAVWPTEDGDLSRWMHWVLSTHVRRYHQHILHSVKTDPFSELRRSVWGRASTLLRSVAKCLKLGRVQYISSSASRRKLVVSSAPSGLEFHKDQLPGVSPLAIFGRPFGATK